MWGVSLKKLVWYGGLMPNARANDPKFDPERLQAKHDAAREAKNARQRSMSVCLSAPAMRELRELRERTGKQSVGQTSYSELVELLVAHWKQHPPPAAFVLGFEFQTKRGRPAKSE